MATPDYWGAPVPHQPVCPTAGYFPFPPTPKNFTPRPENSDTPIEIIHQQILSQHPEEMSAAADQWQNLHDFISGIGEKVREKSQTLHDETWKSPQAAAEFLKRGPGATLAALDLWKAAAAANRDALRALVGMATKARSDMDALWSQFLKDVEYAKYIHHSDVGDWFGGGWAMVETMFGYQNALPDYEKQKVKSVHDDYSQKARVLAYRVALAYFEIMNHYGVAGQGLGFGPSFKPMNARLSAIGHDPLPGPGSVPPAPPAPPAPPQLHVSVPSAPVLPAVAPPAGPLPVGPAPVGLRGLTAPGVVHPAGLPAVLAGPGLGLGLGLSLGPDSTRRGLGARTPGGPGTNGADNLKGLMNGLMPGAPTPSGIIEPEALNLPGTPDVNSLPEITALEGGAEPPASLRSPMATAANGRSLSGSGAGMEEPPPGRGQAASEERRRRVWEPMPGVEEAFTASPGGTVPGVLSAPQLGGTGTGGSAGFGGKAGSGFGGLGDLGEPPALRPGVAKTPATQRRRPRPIAPGEPGMEWLGLEEALEGASEPVLDAPEAVVVEEDTSLGLRTPAFESAGASAPTRRRTADQEPAKVAVDEEAWTVPTPGGGVLGGQSGSAGDDEPGAALRAIQA